MHYSKEYMDFRSQLQFQLKLEDEHGKSFCDETIDELIASYDEFRLSDEFLAAKSDSVKVRLVTQWALDAAITIVGSTLKRESSNDSYNKMVLKVVFAHANYIKKQRTSPIHNHTQALVA